VVVCVRGRARARSARKLTHSSTPQKTQAFAAPLPPGPARAARLLHAAGVLGRNSPEGRAALRLAAADLKEVRV
jgi:hypothetical protein